MAKHLIGEILITITEHAIEAHEQEQRSIKGVERRGADPAPRGHRGGVRRPGRPRPEAGLAPAAAEEEGRQAEDGLQRAGPTKRQACTYLGYELGNRLSDLAKRRDSRNPGISSHVLFFSLSLQARSVIERVATR